ncbi:MAG: hypothetical protein Q8N34_08510 [Gammaproteobacteria bacterium]|nr:hypothetical protein [Gammaproteobacteria bacterium]
MGCKKQLTFLLSVLLLTNVAAAQQSIVIDGVSYRDPTRPAGATLSQTEFAAVPGRPTYTVTFIRAGSTNNVAVINGQVVSRGDRIDGALVKAIDDDSVLLEVNGETLEISTFRANFRTPASAP